MYKIQITDTESDFMITAEAEAMTVTTMTGCRLNTITLNENEYVATDAIDRSTKTGNVQEDKP